MKKFMKTPRNWQDMNLMSPWKEIENKYVVPTNGLTTQVDLADYEKNKKARYAIFSALSKTELTKVIYMSTTYEV